MHDAVSLEVSQLLGQHFLRGLGDKTAQLAEAHRLVSKMEKNQRLPLAADHLKCRGYRTISALHGILFDTRFQISAYLSMRSVQPTVGSL
jgi:hypothetical protein